MQKNCFDILPDDALLAVASWIVATGAESLARFSKVNRRFRSVLGEQQQHGNNNANNSSWLTNLLREKYPHVPTPVQTLEQWALWQAVQRAGLEQENRVGFDYASLDIEPDLPRPHRPWYRRRRHQRRHHHDHHHDSDNSDIDSDEDEEERILNSQTRLHEVAALLDRFPRATVRIESHCGTGAPPGIGERFSSARGMAVVQYVLDHSSLATSSADSAARVSDRVHMTPWGRRIAVEAARSSSHRFANLARVGMGWVELYVCHGDELEMPSRPHFYQGHVRTNWQEDRILDQSEQEDDEEDVMEGDESSEATSDQPIPNMGAIETSDDDDDDNEEENDMDDGDDIEEDG